MRGMLHRGVLAVHEKVRTLGLKIVFPECMQIRARPLAAVAVLKRKMRKL